MQETIREMAIDMNLSLSEAEMLQNFVSKSKNSMFAQNNDFQMYYGTDDFARASKLLMSEIRDSTITCKYCTKFADCQKAFTKCVNFQTILA